MPVNIVCSSLKFIYLFLKEKKELSMWVVNGFKVDTNGFIYMKLLLKDIAL